MFYMKGILRRQSVEIKVSVIIIQHLEINCFCNSRRKRTFWTVVFNMYEMFIYLLCAKENKLGNKERKKEKYSCSEILIRNLIV